MLSHQDDFLPFLTDAKTGKLYTPGKIVTFSLYLLDEWGQVFATILDDIRSQCCQCFYLILMKCIYQRAQLKRAKPLMCDEETLPPAQ